jgi:branched-chain amino acid aminotransferase
MGVSFDKIDGVIWYDGRLVPWADANVHILTHGLHYASCVFEGERAYGGKVFRSTAHSERLKNSANILDFEIPYSVAEIDAAKQLVIDSNNLPDAYLFISPSPPGTGRGYFDPAAKLKGIRMCMAEYRRPDPATIPAMAKASGLYMICTISKHKAERAGYADAMMLDWQGRVAECTGANIFFIEDGKIHTPIADCFLAGMPDELDGFTECFITGTAAEVTPVAEIAHWKFTPGKISEQLMADYTAEVQVAQ